MVEKLLDEGIEALFQARHLVGDGLVMATTRDRLRTAPMAVGDPGPRKFRATMASVACCTLRCEENAS